VIHGPTRAARGVKPTDSVRRPAVPVPFNLGLLGWFGAGRHSFTADGEETMTTMMTQGETRRLARLEAKLVDELRDLRLGGLEDRAGKVEEELRVVRAKLQEERQARQDEQSRRWAEEARQKREAKDRERDAERRLQEAVAFLEDLFRGGRSVEVGVVFSAAKEQGIRDGDLLHAAGRMGLRTLGWPRPGTVAVHDRGRGTYWGMPSPFAGMSDFGGPALPG